MEVDRTMTNGVRLEGHVMVPNLGYKKDAFLELSLISNFLLDIAIPYFHNYVSHSPYQQASLSSTQFRYSFTIIIQWFGRLVE